jgi:hypothetical protein
MFNNRNHVQDDRFLPTIIWLKLGLDGHHLSMRKTYIYILYVLKMESSVLTLTSRQKDMEYTLAVFYLCHQCNR